MNVHVHSLSPEEALVRRSDLEALLSEFSEEKAAQIAAGEFCALFLETIMSQQAHVCVASLPNGELVGMYLATVKPAFIGRSLYIDAVVVARKFRGERITKNVLIPHMKKLAQHTKCMRIELTSSRPAAQKAYRAGGFISPTTAFRLDM